MRIRRFASETVVRGGSVSSPRRPAPAARDVHFSVLEASDERLRVPSIVGCHTAFIELSVVLERGQMGLADDTKSGVDGVLKEAWEITIGSVVPETDDVTLKNGGRRVDATYLYADLAGSSKLAQTVKDEIVAKVIRSYLNAAARILKHHGGAIRSYDGDRVMAVFIGSSKNSSAAIAAFNLNWAVQKVIRGKLDTKWPQSLANYTMHHGVGIATGEALIVRAGVRNNNDLVSIGSAPNVAAKLSELRRTPDIYITSGVYDMLNGKAKLRNDGVSTIWSRQPNESVGGSPMGVYATDYWREP